MTPRRHARRSRGRRRRPFLAFAFALVLIGTAFVAPRVHRYSVDYYEQVYLPAAAGPGTPSYYYVDWRRDWSDPDDLGPAVATGPIVTPRASRHAEGDGWRYDPVGLIQAGLSLHDQVLDEVASGLRSGAPGELPHRLTEVEPPELDRLAVLLDQVEWLHRSAEWLPDSVAVWSIPWSAERYGIHPPWISALSQGQAISLLARTSAWGRPQDLVLARAAVRSLLDPSLPIVLSDGGDIRFFEEFPADPPTEVLNGCLFAWLGLWDYVRATGDEALRATCLKLLDRIETQVPDYELGGFGLDGWTRYDTRPERPTSPMYQELHAALADAIAAETGREFWRNRAQSWRRAARPLARRLFVFVCVAWHKATIWAVDS